MKVSSITTILSDKDIMGLIKDFVKVEGLEIKEFKIGDFIEIKGSYKMGININFSMELGVSGSYNNSIYFHIFKLNLYGLSIKFLVNSTIKVLSKKLKEMGITYKKELIGIDLNEIIKKIPGIYFKVSSIKLKGNKLEVGIEDLIYSGEKIEVKGKVKPLEKKKDSYGEIRDKLKKKIPEKYKKIGEYAFIIPDVIDLYWNLILDERVPKSSKVTLVGTFLYLISPIDFIPDYIPFIGSIDDVAIAFFGLYKILSDVDDNVIIENYKGNGDIIVMIKEIIGLVTSIVGGKRVSKLYEFVVKGAKGKSK